MRDTMKVIFREDNIKGFADSGEVLAFLPQVAANPGNIFYVPIGRNSAGCLYFCGASGEMPMAYMTDYKIVHKTDRRVPEYLDFLQRMDEDNDTYVAIEKVMQNPPTM